MWDAVTQVGWSACQVNRRSWVQITHNLIVISFETYISGNFFIVLSNEFTFRVHAGGVLKNYRKYFGKQVLY